MFYDGHNNVISKEKIEEACYSIALKDEHSKHTEVGIPDYFIFR